MAAGICPAYLPNIHYMAWLVSQKQVAMVTDNPYQKQTFRNRTEIYGANGKLALTVPVIYTQKNRQLYKDVRIANDGKWQSQHLKSLESAYRMSPFYEFYIDDLMPLFENKFDFILELNLKCFEILTSCLQIDIDVNYTSAYEKLPTNLSDYRHMVNRNSNTHEFIPYKQVFTEKHGFLSNLSILDLLFNEGPNSELYLKNHSPLV